MEGFRGAIGITSTVQTMQKNWHGGSDIYFSLDFNEPVFDAKNKKGFEISQSLI